MGLKPLATALGSLQSKSGNANVQRARDDRMTLSEAIETVGLMIDCYPQGRAQLTDSYIGNMAALLCEFPRSIAADCIDPRKGVTRDTKFIPTVADIVAWCESRTRYVSNQEAQETARANREAACENQLAERRKYNAVRGEPQKKYNRWNLLVRPDRPGYEQMVERAKHSDPLDYHYEPEGIRVPKSWHDERRSWRPQEQAGAPRPQKQQEEEIPLL